jgi:hypothetical protein
MNDCKCAKTTMLLIANYGSEVAVTAGALALNVRAGGRTHALVLLARPKARPDLERAGKAIGCPVEFADLPYGDVGMTYEQKKRIVKTVREVRPDIVLMQDPEHVWHDLDPDRRMGMMVTLEALALAGRDFAEADLPGLEPHRVPTIYYLWPENPNCAIDISSVWPIKEKASECLKYQHEFSVHILEQMFSKESLAVAVPGYTSLSTDLDKGLALHREMDRASAIYHGMCSHGHFALAEAYRREGLFQLSGLIP